MKLYEITEAWSKKYKKSIDCSNPKGFSQKAHCAGKKKKANENHGKYYCSTDKKWKYRKGPKQSRKKVSEYGVPDYNTMPTYKLKKASKGKQKFFLPSNEPTPKGVEAIDENIFQVGALAAMLGMSASALAQKDIVSDFNDKVESTLQYYEQNPDSADRNKLERSQSRLASKYLGNFSTKISEINLPEDERELLHNLRRLFFNTEFYKDEELMNKKPGWNLTLERKMAGMSAKLVYLAVKKKEKEAESEQEVEENKVTNLKTQKGGTKYPLFSKANIQKAYSEWATGAAVDTDIKIVGKDKKQYVIRQNYDGQSQHFEEGEWYLTDANNNIVNTEGYPDPGELLYDHQSKEDYYPKNPDEIDENQDQSLPPEVKEFVNRLTPSDVGVDTVGKYIIHYEGFTDECNDGHDEESIDKIYDQVYQDFNSRQGQEPLIQGVAYDELGCENNPVLYSVYKNVNENFADGKKKGKSRPGRVKRSGASCKGSVTSLRAKAKKYSGERGKMYHWCANMKGGKKKKKIKEMQTTDYVDQQQFVTHVQELGGSKEVGVKILAAFQFFQKESEDIFYQVEEEKGGYVVDGKQFKDFVSAVQYAKSKGLDLKRSVKSVWDWRKDPKGYTQHPAMVQLRKFIQDRLQQTLNDGKVPIHIIHFDQDEEMRPLFRLNLKTDEGYKRKTTNESVFDQLPLPTWMSHTSLEKMFRQEYGERYGDYLAYMDLDSDDDLTMSSDFGQMALDVAKEHDIKEMNKFLSQTTVQFKVDDLRLDQGVQVWHLVQQPTTVH